MPHPGYPLPSDLSSQANEIQGWEGKKGRN